MNTSSIKVSVIIPSLNAQTYISECIKSALNQTLNDIEIICVDAGSTDGTIDIIKEYKKKDSRIKLIHSDKKSYGFQMNLGLDAATGEYMAILESDDYIEPNMYETMYCLAEKNNVDFIKGDYEIFLGEKDTRTFSYMNSCKKKNLYNKVINPAQEIDIFNARMNTWTGIYNIDFLRKNNIRHNETSGASYQDNGFWFQTFMFAQRIMFIEKAFYKLRRDNPNSSVHNRGKVFCIFEEYEFIEQILRENKNIEKTFIEIFHKKKYDNCQFHYSRVGDEFKAEFTERMSFEFNQAKEKGELNSKLFLGDDYQNLLKIMDFNKSIEYESLGISTDIEKIKYLETQLKSAQWELKNIKNSKVYKISNKLLFIPRKIRGGIKCYSDNGLKYTVNLIFTKCRKLINKGRR